MKYIAIEWEEIDIGFNKYVYLPKGIIEGINHQDLDKFVTDDGKTYGFLATGLGSSKLLYSSPIEKSYLTEKYGDDPNVYGTLYLSQFSDSIMLGRKYNDLLSLYEYQMTISESKKTLKTKLEAEKEPEEDDEEYTDEEMLSMIEGPNNDIAIKVKEVSVGFNKFFYVPEDIITGTYVKETNMFIDENQNEYNFLSTGSPESDLLYISPFNKYKVINEYGTDKNIWKTMLFLLHSDRFIIGRKLEGKLVIFGLNFPLEAAKQNIDIECGLTEDTNNLAEVEKSDDVEEKKTDITEKKVRLKQLREKVLATIKGEDEAVKAVTTQIIKNYRTKNPRNKQHILLAGPSGTGKTEMISIVCKELNIPFTKVVATDYTQEGFVGKSVDQMIESLINTCNGDVKKAENGILVIDEIDKKSPNVSFATDTISSKGVLDSILKIANRDVIQVSLRANTPYEETIDFDTSNLTIVCLGAFAGILGNEKVIIPFGQSETKDSVAFTKQLLIEKGGMPPEFMGRFECFVATKPLTRDNFIDIIKNSEGSQLKLEKEFFQDLGIKVEVEEEYIEEIADIALKKEVGARGIKSAIGESFAFATEQVLDEEEEVENGKYKTLRLTKETVKDPKKYYLV